MKQTIASPGSSTPAVRAARNPKAAKTRRLEFVKDDSALGTYLNDIKNEKTLTMAQERVLADRIRAGDNSAIHTLVQANLKFVVAVCRNYQYQGMALGDLINEGNLGLIRAARRFDATMNFKFISYGVWWIRQAILTALAEQSRVLNISAGRIGVIHRIGKASQKLAQSLGRMPVIGEVADQMGMTEKEVGECLHLASTPVSLDRPSNGDEDKNLGECLPDENAAPADASALKSILSKSMQGLMGTLKHREAEIISLYYGFGAQGSLTLKEIGDKFDLSRERVRQIRDATLQKLRHPSRVKHLECFRN